MQLNDKTFLYAPDYVQIERGPLHLLIDPETPNWIVTDKRGSRIVSDIKECKTVNKLMYDYANDFNIGHTKAWVEIDTFLKDLTRCKFLSSGPVKKIDYAGRADFIHAYKLNELWIHINNVCNLTCSHCLVNSSPSEDNGLTTDAIKKIIDEAVSLGTSLFYFTGGEPFMREDIFGLIEYICNDKKSDLIILTNGTLLKGSILEKLQGCDK